MRTDREDFDISSIKPIVEDFDIFVNYIDKSKHKLTKKLEVLGKKTLFELNNKMTHKKEVDSPKFQQKEYPLLSLLFDLSIHSKIFQKRADEKGNLFLETTKRKDEYSRLNMYEKYIFLLETYWTYLDFESLFEKSFLMNVLEINKLLQIIANSKQGFIIEKGTFSEKKEFDALYMGLTPFFYHLSFFGFIDYKETEDTKKTIYGYKDKIEYVKTKKHGIQMSKILIEKNILDEWNIPLFLSELYEYKLDVVPGQLTKLFDKINSKPEKINEIIKEHNKEMEDGEMFLEAFKKIFPKDTLNKTVKVKIDPNTTKGNFIFKVSLERNLWRKIKLSHNHNLYDLHMAIQEAFNFDYDHLYTFYMDGKKNRKNYFNSSGCEERPYDYEAVIGELGLYKNKKILYLFDYGDMWHFMVTVIEIACDEKEISNPEIIEVKGEAPEQYGGYY